ncbi:acetylserotonin O-methyltransferase isoform X2 [Bos taurus]|uniref:acetylserotonin O-methyltransferase isoform X2 n=1 Tax=Bos taurus TaxID=9913 RepID=UPI0028CBA4B5|nr:acetylserotonin O-methyltransferase isoform X2 [Bos taurus]
MCSQEGEGYSLLKEYANGFMVSQVLFAACELGVFELLAEALEPLDSAAVSSHLGSSPQGTELLLNTCVSLKLLQADVRGGKAVYANTELASTYLVRGSPRSQRDMLLYAGRTAYVCWRHLAEAVREGRNQYLKAFGIPSEELFSAIYRSEDERLQFMQGLQDVWRLEGATVLAAFDLSPFPLICDLGGYFIKVDSLTLSRLWVPPKSGGCHSPHSLAGGSGALAKACVSLYPGCRAIVFDIPGVVQIAKRHFSASEDERISFHEGDFFKDALPEADLYILARVLHDWTDAKCSHLLQRVYRACRTGGGILVIESLLDTDGRGPLTTLLYSLNMLVQTEGRERTPAEYRALLGPAGFRDVRCRRTGGTYDAVLARK